jgi:predicted ATPase/class 3 adenylate cyclase
MASMAGSATVTLLFTDIVGSTQLWETEPVAMSRALARHDEILRSIIETSGGEVFKTVGDAFCAAFTDASDAVTAARDAQLAISAEPWPKPVTLRVRMGIHSGPCERRDEDYFGPTVNRAARLQAVAHGGQVVLSEATATPLGFLPDHVALRDLGDHRLKDLGQSLQIYQLDIEGLETTFPPLRSLDSPRLMNNLPVQLTEFIGRESEMADLRSLLKSSRLVTLMGAGGVGKSRLATQLGADLVDGSGHGVWFVELAPVVSGEMVLPTIAEAMGIRDEPGRSIKETLLVTLRERSLLIIVDNCEHLLESCANAVEFLLRNCPEVAILATSREPLAIDGERTYRVPSMSLPSDSDDISLLSRSEAVRLFVERVHAHDPAFTADDLNGRQVARICQRLDGIPLAIELAAARLRSLSVAELEARLHDRFGVLSRGGGATAVPRHRTLRALVDWSYDLLIEPERWVLQDMSVFSGGVSLDAAEAVCGGGDLSGFEVVDLVAALTDKSLIQADVAVAPTRYRILETIRQYAEGRLAERGATASTRRRHAIWFLEMAEMAEPHLTGGDQAAWQKRLRVEHDNLRIALDEFLRDPSAGDEVRRFAIASPRFWYTNTSRPELNETVGKILAHPGFRHDRLHWAEAVAAIAQVQAQHGELRTIYAEAEEALAILRPSKKHVGCARLLCAVGFHKLTFESEEDVTKILEESVTRARESEDMSEVGLCLCVKGLAAVVEGDLTTAQHDLDEAMDCLRVCGDLQAMAVTVNNRPLIDMGTGDLESARYRLEEAIEIVRGLGDRWMLPLQLDSLGLTWVALGNPEKALTIYRESLEASDRVGNQDPCSILGLALCASALGNLRKAAVLHGAAIALGERRGERLDPVQSAAADQDRTRLQELLGPVEFGAASEEGAQLTFDQIVMELREEA